MRTLTVLAWLLGTAAMSFPAFAWGDVGRRVICQIAYEELNRSALVPLLPTLGLPIF
jgi:hypothetical protein